MASASKSSAPIQDSDTSYSKMSVGDVEAIGSHCQMSFCRQLDFLPFRCESCRGTYCLDHRSETAHSCPQAGAWARRRQQALAPDIPSPKPSPRPNILNHEQQCSDPSCKTLINTPLTTGVHCDKCRRSYCLKHRFTYDHNCANLTPLGLESTRTGPTQKERGLAALEKLRAWGANKKAHAKSSLATATTTKSSASAAARTQALVVLKKSAKGDDKIPQDKRVYLHVEASSDTISAKIPRGEFFYHVDWSIGRILDLAAKSLAVSNLNNRANGEEDRLRVFHVEGGRLLEFGEKLGTSGIVTGHTIVLLRGVGPGMAKTPENVDD